MHERKNYPYPEHTPSTVQGRRAEAGRAEDATRDVRRLDERL
jgi:hypothetical protein